MKLKVTVNGTAYDVDVEVEDEPVPTLGAVLMRSTSAYGVTPTAAKAPAGSSSGLKAPISGTVVKILVEVGAQVKAGDTVVVLEAMKMENALTAPVAGTIKRILIKAGDPAKKGDVLLVIG